MKQCDDRSGIITYNEQFILPILRGGNLRRQMLELIQNNATRYQFQTGEILYFNVERHLKQFTMVDVNETRIVFQAIEPIHVKQLDTYSYNTKPFCDTSISEYLNGEFLDTFFGNDADLLLRTEDNLKITLLTAAEILGDNGKEDDERMYKMSSNWKVEDQYQFEYFKKCRNRLKYDENDELAGYWTKSPCSKDLFDYCNISYTGDIYCMSVDHPDPYICTYPSFALRLAS